MGHCAGCAFAGMCGGAYPLREAMYIALMELDMDTKKLDDLYSIICRFAGVDEKFPVEVKNIVLDDCKDEG